VGVRAAPSIVGWLWTAFVLLWLLLSRFSKKASRGAPWSGWGMRLAVVVGVLMVISAHRHAITGRRLASVDHSLRFQLGIPGQWVGVGLCLAGFGFAIWARGHLGRNWGMPMSLRQGHELVTSGPYAYVRHPIYTGIMLAMIGSALAVSVLWMILFLFYFAYFIFSARTEENMMIAQFPDTYPAYRRRTKMLIPFVF
jgi:protein-S-isoprenylcysteine O-methyltransferase Ste14